MKIECCCSIKEYLPEVNRDRVAKAMLACWTFANLYAARSYLELTPASLGGGIGRTFRWMTTGKNWRELPGRIKAFFNETNIHRIPDPEVLVYPMWASISITHGLQAYHKRDNWKELAIHSASAMLAAWYPLGMQTGHVHYGFHHMSYGLACLIPRLAGLNVFGLGMVLDEIITYNELHLFPWYGNQWGFDNIFADNIYLFSAGLILATVYELHQRSLDEKAAAMA